MSSSFRKHRPLCDGNVCSFTVTLQSVKDLFYFDWVLSTSCVTLKLQVYWCPLMGREQLDMQHIQPRMGICSPAPPRPSVSSFYVLVLVFTCFADKVAGVHVFYVSNDVIRTVF